MKTVYMTKQQLTNYITGSKLFVSLEKFHHDPYGFHTYISTEVDGQCYIEIVNE